MACARDVFSTSWSDADWPNKGAAANRRYAIEFVSHWFYNLSDFGGRALPAPAPGLSR